MLSNKSDHIFARQQATLGNTVGFYYIMKPRIKKDAQLEKLSVFLYPENHALDAWFKKASAERKK